MLRATGLVTAAELRKLLSDCDSALDSCTIADEFDNFDEEHTGKIGFYQFLRMFRQHLIDLEVRARAVVNASQLLLAGGTAIAQLL